MFGKGMPLIKAKDSFTTQLSRCSKVPRAGFSLIEMMIVIAIIALLSAIAIPSYQQLILNREINSASKALRQMIDLGLSQAINRDNPLIITPFSFTANDYIWQEGWQLIDDSNQNHQFDPNESVLGIYRLPQERLSIWMKGPGNGVKIIIYPDQTLWPNSSVYFCHPSHPRLTRLILFNSGRMRKEFLEQDCDPQN